MSATGTNLNASLNESAVSTGSDEAIASSKSLRLRCAPSTWADIDLRHFVRSKRVIAQQPAISVMKFIAEKEW